MLSRWRADVSKWLTVKEACSRITGTHHQLVTLAWHFLTSCGYINFGARPLGRWGAAGPPAARAAWAWRDARCSGAGLGEPWALAAC